MAYMVQMSNVHFIEMNQMNECIRFVKILRFAYLRLDTRNKKKLKVSENCSKLTKKNCCYGGRIRISFERETQIKNRFRDQEEEEQKEQKGKGKN